MNKEPDPFDKELPPGPFDKDILESKGSVKKNEVQQNAPLSEENFIQENKKQPSTVASIPLWLWPALLTIAASLIWGSLGWFQGIAQKEIASRPFLEVTNREFSEFLWQFPVYMRPYAKQKTGYLPGFQQGDRYTMNLSDTEQLVSAPPEVLFLYHTWKRLLSQYYIARPIQASEFTEFLEAVPEWKPEYWKAAPADYVKLIDSKTYIKEDNLDQLPETTLPLVVKKAFQGWKNFYKEGEQINKVVIDSSQLKEFLATYPQYSRSYWRNIQYVLEKQVAGAHYLESFPGKKEKDESISAEQLAPFLKVALYNWQQANKA